MTRKEKGSKQAWWEYRRQRVWEMHEAGYRQQAIGDALGLSQSGVSRIVQRGRMGGVVALQRRKAEGRTARLTLAQKAMLLEKLRQGATAHGFQGEVWTCERVAVLIEREFGVKYHADYIGPLLRSCGWSVQKPVVRATQRDEAALQQWWNEGWPALKKKALSEEYTLLFLDESAFYLLPGVTRTWAPKGETPILRSKLSRDHLSVISAITPEGALYFQTRDAAFDSAAVIDFLELLLAQIAGKLLIIWDGAPIHRSKVIKGYLAAGAAKRIRLERLPAYAPDLNPDEAIWHHLKHVELNNFPCRDLPHLCQELLAAFARLARRPDLIKACFYQLGYYDKST